MSAAPTPSPALPGTLARANDPAWESSRAAFNVLLDQRPAAVGLPTDERDVAALVRHAAESGLQVAPRGSGHNAGPLGSLENALLLDTSRMQSISIDAEARWVRAGAGVKWERVIGALSDCGLAALHGSSPDVGVVGYSLGGGIGWLARRLGLQCNSVLAIELVTADGELLRTDPDHDPDLFWALRGGGGSFGAVTAIEFETYPLASVYAGGMFFEFDRSAEVLRAWSELIGELPEEITTWAFLMHVPDMPTVPQELRGRSFAIVLGACTGGEQAGHAALEPIRRLGPVMDTFANVPPASLGELAMDPPEPVPYRSTHALLDDLPQAMIEEIVAAAGPGSGLLLVQLRHLGGALKRAPAGAGARAVLDGEISMFALGMVMDPAAEGRLLTSLATVGRACASPARYLGFVEEPTDASRFYDRTTWDRLQRVKARYDPEDRFRGNHHVPAPGVSAASDGRVAAARWDAER